MSEPSRRRARHAPKIGPFLLTGGLLGLVAGLVISAVGPATNRYGAMGELGFLGLGCAALGVLLGGILFVLLDRRA